MPVEVCKLSRANRSKICRNTVEQSPNHGYFAAQKSHYFGYKLHAVCTANGVFKAFDITKASVHDIHYLNNVKTPFSNCIFIGDRGYLSQQYQNYLFDSNSIKLTTPARKNQLNPLPFNRSFSKARKRDSTKLCKIVQRVRNTNNFKNNGIGHHTID